MHRVSSTLDSALSGLSGVPLFASCHYEGSKSLFWLGPPVRKAVADLPAVWMYGQVGRELFLQMHKYDA